MKKIIAVFCMICMLGCMTVSVFAGDIPEALSYDDDAKVFIGTLISAFNSPMGPASGGMDVVVQPTLKLKGEVDISSDDTFECCYFVNTEPKIGAEYFFGWLSNTSVYAYEVKSRTDDQITIHIVDEFSERIQNYLDEGLYQKSETQRLNVGEKVTLTEYLNTDSESIEEVVFSLNGMEYDINTEAFIAVADSIMITDVKNHSFNRMGADDWADDILYITVTNKQSTMGNPEFACITRFCEVDRWNGSLSRLPNCDYTMEWEDLASIYTFLPEDIQKALYEKNMGETQEPPISVILIIIVGIFLVATGFVVYSKRQKNHSK